MSDFWDKSEVIIEMEKGKNILKFQVTEKDGKEFIDVREWFTSNNKEYPTKKGLTIAAEVVDDFMSLLKTTILELKTLKNKNNL